MKKVKRLICSCCGGTAFSRQYWNQDKGYGLCRRCVPRILSRQTVEETEFSHGKRGYNWDVDQPIERVGPPTLFIGIFPAGVSYCDKSYDDHDTTDYHRVAFLPYSSLVLEVHDAASPLIKQVIDHAKDLQSKRGQQFAVSASQFIILGS